MMAFMRGQRHDEGRTGAVAHHQAAVRSRRRAARRRPGRGERRVQERARHFEFI